MNIKSYPLKRGQWFEEATEKKYVVWHGTAGRTLHTPSSGRPGRATTSVDGWNLDALRVGAPYLRASRDARHLRLVLRSLVLP